MTVYVVILNTPNEHPLYRVVGVFGNRDNAQLAGEFEAEEAGNDSWYEIHEDDGKDLGTEFKEPEYGEDWDRRKF